MNVFDQLPKDFFRILTGKNQGVFVEALMVLRDSFKLKELHLDREVLVVRIAERLSQRQMVLELEDEDAGPGSAFPEPDARFGSASTSGSDDGESATLAMARWILRRLQATGWVETEEKPKSFEIQVTLPPYVVAMLELLHGIMQEDTQSYRNHAFDTFSALKTVVAADAREHAFLAFDSALRKSEALDDALKVLLNNIRRYHRRLSDFATANEVLKEHFDGYETLVNERIFHPMVTRDSVLRFRQPVLTLLERILDDEALLAEMVLQGVAEKRLDDPERGLEDVRRGLLSIRDVFEDVDRIMQEIQAKNYGYTKAATDKMIYLVNQDRGVKEKTARILMMYPKLDEGERRLVSEGTRLFRQAWIDERSVLVRSGRKVRTAEAPLKLRPKEERGEEMSAFLRMADSKYGHRKVMDRMKAWFGEMDVIASEELAVEQEEDFILLLLGVLKAGEARVFYDAEFLEGTVEREGYRYPRVRFLRRKAGEGTGR